MVEKTAASDVVELAFTPDLSEELFSPDCQKSFGNALSDLQAHGLKVSCQMHFQDSADSGGMWFLGQFTIEAAKIAAPVITGAASAYLVARVGRKVKLKQGDVEVEAHSVEELRTLLKIANEQRPPQ